MLTNFTIPFCAGKQRPRFSKTHAYKTKDESLREEAIKLAFEESGGIAAPKGVPVSVKITATKSSEKRANTPFVMKPDADNIAKLVLDALNGVAWHDDAQIVSLDVVKLNHTKNVNRISVEIDWSEADENC